MKAETKAVWWARVDWLRVTHRLAALARGVRGDDALDDDHRTDKARSSKLLNSLDGVARQALNCRAPQACPCPMCEGESR